MGVAFHVGPFTIDLYGILIATGVSCAIVVAIIEAKRRGEDPDNVLNLALAALPLGFIGARAYHVIDQWAYYSQHPAQIIGGAGLGIFGAEIGGAIGMFIFTRWKKLSMLRWLDIIAPGLILAQGIGRWGNFFNQELYGYPSKLPWALYISPSHRLPGFQQYSYFQPLFFYEFMVDISGFIALMVIGRKLKHKLLDGEIFSLYVLWYGTGRFFLENLKPNSWTLFGIATAQWIAGFGILAVILIYIFRHRRLKMQIAGAGPAGKAMLFKDDLELDEPADAPSGQPENTADTPEETEHSDEHSGP